MAYPLLQLLYLIPIITSLVLCIRHRSLSQYMPLLIGGFAANLAVLVLNTGILYGIRFIIEGLHQSYNPGWSNLYPITSLLSLGSWGLIACGLGFVLNDVRQKLQCLEVTPQCGWNYAQNRQQNSQANAQNSFSQNSFQQHREETHASPFASASAPFVTPALSPTSAPVAGEPAPACTVRAPEPDVVLPLGSSHS